jgi:hypothetical protein
MLKNLVIKNTICIFVYLETEKELTKVKLIKITYYYESK